MASLKEWVRKRNLDWPRRRVKDKAAPELAQDVIQQQFQGERPEAPETERVDHEDWKATAGNDGKTKDSSELTPKLIGTTWRDGFDAWILKKGQLQGHQLY